MSQSAGRTSHSWIIRLVVSLVILGSAAWVLLNRQLVTDQITVWRSEPSAAVQKLAERSDMSDRGAFVFYASTPEILGRDSFIDKCKSTSEQTAILGCYVAQEIYVFDVTDERLDGIQEVTAAHEMLHGVYERMSDSERKTVDGLVEKAYESASDDRLDGLLEYYAEAEPGERANELFALLGTEYADLPEELEKVYTEYFDDRSVVVGLYNEYDKTFAEVQAKQTALVDSLNSLASNIESATKSYNQSIASLSASIDSFNTRAKAGDFNSQSEFNTERASLASRQAELDARRSSIQSDIDTYEDKRSQLGELSTVVDGLYRSINANLPETPSL